MTEDTLARKLFLILHDSFSGKPSAPHTLVMYGVVEAAFADLIMQRRLGVENDRIIVTGPRTSGDDVSTFVYDSVVQRRPGFMIARSNVEALTTITYELVARGLVADGVVRRMHGSRRLVRRGADRFPAVDLLRAAGPRIRLEHMLRSPHDLDVPGAVLARIVHTLEMDRVFDVDRDRAAVKGAAASAAQILPADLRGLIDEFAAAVSEVTLTFRRL